MISFLRRIRGSVSFIPSIIAIGFGFFALFLIFSPKININSTLLEFIYVEDKSDIQFVLACTIGGIFTLTVFSFSMVMTTINQSISSYSPRIVPLLLAAKDNQYILGFTSGSIVYSLVMSLFLVNLKPFDFPKLAAFFAILFCITSVILFIYFIHSVTQSIHINHLLRQSFNNTKKNLNHLKEFEQIEDEKLPSESDDVSIIRSEHCGFFNMPNFHKLYKIADKHNLKIWVQPYPGGFIYENDTICIVEGQVSQNVKKHLLRYLKIDKSEPMNVPAIGLKHLVEVAIRASAPGEKDIGTSLAAIQYFTQLAIYRQKLKDNYLVRLHKDSKNFIYFKIVAYDILIDFSIKEMRSYMEDDSLLMKHLSNSLSRINKDLE